MHALGVLHVLRLDRRGLADAHACVSPQKRSPEQVRGGHGCKVARRLENAGNLVRREGVIGLVLLLALRLRKHEQPRNRVGWRRIEAVVAQILEEVEQAH
jgi:hypothetical protein